MNKWLMVSGSFPHNRQVAWICTSQALIIWRVFICRFFILHRIMEYLVGILGHIPFASGSLWLLTVMTSIPPRFLPLPFHMIIFPAQHSIHRLMASPDTRISFHCIESVLDLGCISCKALSLTNRENRGLIPNIGKQE